jgi:hypothetical protein
MTTANDSDAASVMALLADAKRIAQKYHALTGRPLGITGEVAEYEAVRLLGLEPSPVRQPGYDAVRHERDGRAVKLQVKGRCIRDKSKKSQRLVSIKLAYDWDAVLMVLMDERFETVAIYEADRAAIERALTETESRARKRGALAVSKFKAIGRRVWPAP